MGRACGLVALSTISWLRIRRTLPFGKGKAAMPSKALGTSRFGRIDEATPPALRGTQRKPLGNLELGTVRTGHQLPVVAAHASALPLRLRRTIGPVAPPGAIPAFREEPCQPYQGRRATTASRAVGTDDDRSISSQTPWCQINHGMVAQSFHFPARLAIRVRQSWRWREDEENQHADGAPRGAGGPGRRCPSGVAEGTGAPLCDWSH